MAASTPVQWFDRLDSTNSEAKRQASAGATGPLWIAAQEQYSGRGRLDRVWDGGSGNLLATGLYPNTLSPEAASQLSFAAALAVYEVISPKIHDAVTIKWPNDVLVDGKKISGILLESGPKFEWVCVGIGINVASHPSADETRWLATHLEDHLGQHGDALTLDNLLAALIAAFENWRDILVSSGFEPLKQAWTKAAHGIGEKADVMVGNERKPARLLGLSATGGMDIELDNGGREVITAGDIFFPGRIKDT